jgi:hypothetical protein
MINCSPRGSHSSPLSVTSIIAQDLEVEKSFYAQGHLDINKTTIGGRRVVKAINRNTGYINITGDANFEPQVPSSEMLETLKGKSNPYMVIRQSGRDCLELGGWHLEAQREGVFLIAAGLADPGAGRGRPYLVDWGIKAIQWGFDRQAVDGGFAAVNKAGEYVGTCDLEHQTVFFIEAAAHAYLLLAAAGQNNTPEIQAWPSKIRKAALWMMSENVRRPITLKNSNGTIDENAGRDPVWKLLQDGATRYGHRAFVVASALGMSYKVLELSSAFQGDDSGMFAQKIENILNTSDGNVRMEQGGIGSVAFHSENGGPDTSYQMVSLMYASRLARFFPNSGFTSRLMNHITLSSAWAETRMVSCDASCDAESGVCSVGTNSKLNSVNDMQELREAILALDSITLSLDGNTRVTADSRETTASGSSKNMVDMHRAVRALKYIAVLKSNRNDSETASAFNQYLSKAARCYLNTP